MRRFPETVRVQVKNHIDGRTYYLVPAGTLPATPAVLANIVSICNEPEVFQWLFDQILHGARYNETNAVQWLDRAKEGWASESHFIFAVIDGGGRIAAACDIKSNEPAPEIGYWASAQHAGVMTNAVIALSTLASGAGFERLVARTKPGNTKSQGVLERAGFRREAERREDYVWFSRELCRTAP